MIDRVPFKDIELSRLGLGTMRLPVKGIIKREANPIIDYKEAQKLVDFAIENGINYFDTAYMYHAGKSEKFIGTALSKYPRESYYLVDKLPIWMCKKPADMEKIFSNQLKRTGKAYFDNYLLHSLDKNNYLYKNKLTLNVIFSFFILHIINKVLRIIEIISNCK